MPLDRRTQIAGGIRHAHHLVPKMDPIGFAVGGGLQPHRLAAKEDFRAEPPGLRPHRPGRLPLKLLLDPRGVPLREFPRLGFRSAARYRYAHGAVGPHAQDVTPRPAMAHQAKPHGTRADDQLVVARRLRAQGAEEKLELHGGSEPERTGFDNPMGETSSASRSCQSSFRVG